MRILVLNWRDSAHPGAGGAEVWAHRISEHWVSQGHQVTFFASAIDGKPANDELHGVQIVRRGSRLTVYREARTYWMQQAGRFDAVVESVNTRPFDCPSFVGDVPLITMIHQLAREVWFHEAPLPAALLGRYVLEPYWLRKYRNAKVTTSAESGRESFLQYGLRNVEVIPMGRELPEIVPEVKKETIPTVIFCGRLASNKRPAHAIEAFNRLRVRLPEAQMWVVGGGDQERSLRRKARENITFFGHVSRDEKFELMARAHALLVTSVREGWGLVVTEAGAVGTATVAYDVAGLRDSVTTSHGVLVPASPSAMADRLAEVLPVWVNGYPKAPQAGGALPWSDVAQRVLASTGVMSNPEVTIDLRDVSNDPSSDTALRVG